MDYTVMVTFVVIAEDDSEATHQVEQFLQAAMSGEPGPIMSFSVEAAEEVEEE